MKYGYIRVSSDKQTVENQRFEIEQFCLREGVQIDGWIGHDHGDPELLYASRMSGVDD